MFRKLTLDSVATAFALEWKQYKYIKS